MRIGVLGVGYWGLKVLREYFELLNEHAISELYVYDVNPLLKAKLGESFEGVDFLNNIDDLMDNVDAVHICTPNETHYEILLMALKHNVDALVEKPLTNNSKTSFIINENFISAGLILQVGNIFRFTNVLPIAKNYITDNLGAIKHINVVWTHKAPSINSLNQDVRWDLLPHILDIMNFLTSDWPHKVIYSLCNPRDESTKARSASLGLEYFQDLFVDIRISLENDIIHRDIELICDKGTIYINPVKQDMIVYNGSSKKVIEVVANNTIKDEIVNFISCIGSRKNTSNSSSLGLMIVKEIERIIG